MQDKDLLSELKGAIGADRVSDNMFERILYGKDVTPIYTKWMQSRDRPPYLSDCVVMPADTRDLVNILKLAKKHNQKVTVYGGGSGGVGGIIPLGGGITINMSGFDRIIGLDNESLTVEVESGVIGQNLEDFLNSKGLTLRHFPQSMRSGSVGGFIATRSTGQFSTKYGGIENFVVGLEAVLPNGRVLATSDAPRSSTGPDINNIIIGSEGVLGVITKAVLKVYRLPESMVFNCYVYKDVDAGLDCIREIMQSGLRPPVVRLYNLEESRQKFEKLGFKRQGCLLILCFEGMKKVTQAEGSIAHEICSSNGGDEIDNNFGWLWYENRFDTKLISKKASERGGITDTIEVAASWSKVKRLYKDIEGYFKKNNITIAYHFSHAYTNGISVYNIFFANAASDRKAIDLLFKIWDDVLAITLKDGGTVSHHHGIGFMKAKPLRKELGEGYQILLGLKKLFDPDNLLNPGKLITDGKDTYEVVR